MWAEILTFAWVKVQAENKRVLKAHLQEQLSQASVPEASSRHPCNPWADTSLELGALHPHLQPLSSPSEGPQWAQGLTNSVPIHTGTEESPGSQKSNATTKPGSEKPSPKAKQRGLQKKSLYWQIHLSLATQREETHSSFLKKRPSNHLTFNS